MDISSYQLRRYVKMRQKTDPELRLLESLTGLLAQLEYVAPDERSDISPVAIGIVNAAMMQSARTVREALDEFLSAEIAEARLENRQDRA